MVEGVRGKMSPGSIVNQQRGLDHASELHPRLAAMRAQGLSFAQVAMRLNISGIRTRHGFVWRAESVRAVFRLHLRSKVLSNSERPLAPGPATVRRRALSWQVKTRPVLFDLQLHGLSYSQIADLLNERGIRTRQLARWTTAGVREILI